MSGMARKVFVLIALKRKRMKSMESSITKGRRAKERYLNGILFKEWKRQAIRENPGREWHTRRLDGLKIINQEPSKWTHHPECSLPLRFTFTFDNQEPYNRQTAIVTVRPSYQVGEVAYIKEAIHRFNVKYASYSSDYTPVMFLQSTNRFHWRWKRGKLSPLFLPYNAARDFAQVTGVGVERLTLPLTPEELEREGGERALEILGQYDGKWVWVYSFKLIEGRIEWQVKSPGIKGGEVRAR